jgi:hypothetical protein
MSEDAYQGDAMFTVKVDGVSQGGTYTTTALHAAGQSQNFIFNGDWAPGSHKVTITFLNDDYGGTASTDRNLYLNDAVYDGVDTGAHKTFLSNGSKSFTVTDTTAIPSPTPTPTPPPTPGPTPPPPTGTVVNVTPGMDIQAAINNNPTGTTFKFAAGTYTGVDLTPKDGDVFDGTAGAILDGQNSTVHAFEGSAQNVTIDGFTIEHYTAPAQDAPVHGDTSYGWIVENNTIAYNAGHMQVLHNNVNHNLQIGVDANNLDTTNAQDIVVGQRDRLQQLYQCL